MELLYRAGRRAAEHECSDLAGGVLHHAGDDVRIDFESDRHRRVPEHFRHDLDVYPDHRGHDCEGVSQIVEAHLPRQVP